MGDRDDLALGLGFRFSGRPVAFTFPTAGVDTEILHQTGEIPGGYLVLQSRGLVTRAPVAVWATKTLVTLRSSVANDEVILQFVVFKYDPINVNP